MAKEEKNSFVATARKWRPQRFEDVVGQEHITTTIKNAFKNNRIAHAYIFAGPRGVGKTTTARILAKALNCTNLIDGDPCNECDMCKSFNSSQSMDIIEIDGASNRRIEEVRTLRESVKYAPTVGKYKVYIIDEVHMLTTESFNALLKTLEEPPEHTVFIFATTDVHKVPLTIISRCQRFDFRRIDLQTTKNQIKKIADNENIKIDDASLTIIAKKSDGALRDAQSLFDQVVSFSGNDIKVDTIITMMNLINEDIYFDVSDATLQKNFRFAFDVSGMIYEKGWNFIDFVNGLIEHFRNIIVVVISKDTTLLTSSDLYYEKYLSYKDEFSEGDLLRIVAFLNGLLKEIKNSQDQRLKIELGLYQLIGLEKSSTISDLLKRINDIPETLGNIIPEKKKLINELKETPTPQKAEVPKVLEKVEDNSAAEKENSSNNISIDIIQERWNDFIEFLTKSDKLFCRNLIASKVVNFNGIKLLVALDHPEDYLVLTSEDAFLNSKLEEFFSAKIKIEFEKPSKKNTSINTNDESFQNSSLENESPLIKAIITELEAKEIKSL